jgi:cytochrome c biogenesis protein CcmG, thiol:disulfide interchange protein DsbE
MQPQTRWRIFIIILAAGMVWTIASADRSGMSTAGRVPAPRAEFLAPDINLKTPTGEVIKLSDLRGQAVLINLWATWCPPCRAEMPAIQKLYEEYQDQGFTVLAINMTFQDDPLAVVPFMLENGLTFPLLLDETGQAAASYELRSLPSSYFIDREGIIQDVVVGGPMSEALLRTRIEGILK